MGNSSRSTARQRTALSRRDVLALPLGAMAAWPTFASAATGDGALTSVTLRNGPGHPTPSSTLAAFGHPFRKGDIGANQTIAVTLKNGTRQESQVDQVTTWNDGSIRFCVIKVRTGVIAPSGGIELLLHREAAPHARTFPGGKTSASILADINANHDFGLNVEHLTIGLEKPAGDGGGSWYWRAADQFALPGGRDDGSGIFSPRLRVELLEQGPLCAFFRVWGPLREKGSGAEHPHLIVIGYYRAWLTATGAVDRIEHVHAIHQGWIGSLRGGTATPPGLQTGDWELTYNGKVVPDTSLGRALKISHHSRHFCVSPKGKPLWTANGSTLYPKFDTFYWFQTRVPPPYDIRYFEAHPLSPTKEEQPITYQAGNRVPGKNVLWFNAGGEGQHLELMPVWSIRAYLIQDPGFIDSDDVTGLFWGHQPGKVLSEETGRLPTAVRRTFPDLGAAHPQTYFLGVNQHTKDFPQAEMYNPVRKNQLVGYGDTVEDTQGGWNELGRMSHAPSPNFYPYLRTGGPWHLDLMVLDASTCVLGKGTESRDVEAFGTTYEGIWSAERIYIAERVEAWSFKAATQALAVLPPSYPERAYIDYAWSQNCDYAASLIDHASAGQKTTGAWVFLPTRFTSVWMQVYLFLARCHECLMLEDERTRKFVEFHSNFIRGLGGDAVAGYSCGWMMGSYETIVGKRVMGSTGDYFSSWDQMPDYMNDRPASFDAETGYVVAKLQKPVVDGDQVMFCANAYEDHDKPNGNPPPHELVEYRPYWVIDADAARQRFKISATRGGPPLAFSTSVTKVGLCHKKTAATCPPTGSADTAGLDLYSVNKLGLYYAAVSIGKLAGLTGLDTALKNATYRVTEAGQSWSSAIQGQGWLQSPKHKIATSFK